MRSRRRTRTPVSDVLIWSLIAYAAGLSRLLWWPQTRTGSLAAMADVEERRVEALRVYRMRRAAVY